MALTAAGLDRLKRDAAELRPKESDDLTITIRRRIVGLEYVRDDDGEWHRRRVDGPVHVTRFVLRDGRAVDEESWDEGEPLPESPMPDELKARYGLIGWGTSGDGPERSRAEPAVSRDTTPERRRLEPEPEQRRALIWSTGRRSSGVRGPTGLAMVRGTLTMETER